MPFQAIVKRKAAQRRDNWSLGTSLFMQLGEAPSQADEFSRTDAPSRYRKSARIIFSKRPRKKYSSLIQQTQSISSLNIEMAMKSSPPVLFTTQVCCCAQYNMSWASPRGRLQCRWSYPIRHTTMKERNSTTHPTSETAAWRI